MLEGSAVGELGEKGEGIKKHKLVVKNSNEDVKNSIGNIVKIIITMYGARWVLKMEEHFVKCMSNHYSVHMKLIILNIN